MDQYKIAFELSDRREIWWFPILFLALLCIGFYLVKRYRRHKLMEELVGWTFLIIGLAGPLLFGWAFYSSFSYKRALLTGRYNVVTGRVEHFHPMPIQGHSEETFVVSGVRFSYSDYEVTYCFNQSASHGGPIRDGLPVRISYIDNCILKLETGE